MKKLWTGALLALLVLALAAPAALAASALDGTTHEHVWSNWDIIRHPTCTSAGSRIRICRYCQQQQTETIPKEGHSWGGWQTVRKATCTQTGLRERRCSVCGETQQDTIAKSEHDWGSWRTVREATCQSTGLRERTCRDCGYEQQDTVAKSAHRYGKWTTVKEPTCAETGLRERTCRDCGHRSTESLKKTAHRPGAWSVSKEPTCKSKGEREARCAVCGTPIRESLPKVDHKYGDWAVTKEATDHSKGKRASACVFCGKKKTEDFYPDGTLAPDLPNSEKEVAELQSVLDQMGFFDGKITRRYDKQTSSAVRKFQKKAGLKSDGIAWPQTRRLLGAGSDGKPVTEDPEKFTLKLAAELLSEQKESYLAGDKLTFGLTMANAAKKSDAKKARLASFRGISPGKEDQNIADLGDIPAGSQADAEYVYEVTKKDEAAGKLFIGFIGRAKLGSKNAKTNYVYFAFDTGETDFGDLPAAPDSPSKHKPKKPKTKPEETPEPLIAPETLPPEETPEPEETPTPEEASPANTGWTPPTDYELEVTKSVDGGPENGTFFKKGEKITFKITVTNPNNKPVTNVIATDKMFPEMKGNIGTLKAETAWETSMEYEVQAEDVGKGGVTNDVVVSYTAADGKLKTAKASVTALTGMDDGGLFVYKSAKGVPKEELFYLPDEEVEFLITVANPTKDKTFTSMRLYDWLFSKKIPIATESKVGPGETLSYTFKTKVTELQAKQGHVTNIVRVSYHDPDESGRISVSNACTVPAGLKGQDGVIVTKTVISEPENGEYYQEGEEIRYLIEVTNNTVTDIHPVDLRDSLAEKDDEGHRTILKDELIKAGETLSFHFSYTVDEQDVENTKVTNKASAVWATDERMDRIETFSEPVTVPTAKQIRKRKPKPPELTYEEPDRACEVVLSAFGEGTAHTDLAECRTHGETATRTHLFMQVGETGRALSLWDADIDTLYREWAARADAEGRRNAEDEQTAFRDQVLALETSMALVCGTDEARRIAEEERLDKCVSLCYELHTAPQARRDLLEANPAGLPASSESLSCTHTASQAEDGSVHYRDAQCEEHRQTSEAALYMLQLAADEADRAAAWVKIQDSWIADLDHMYDVWYLSAPEEQRGAIAEDRMSFDRLIAARRLTLADLYPDSPAAAAEVLANMIMERTETVCRVLHAAGVLTE